MLTALLVAALARPQTVTFTHPCAHSSVVLEKLGEALGTPIKASGSVLKDFYFIHVSEVTREKLMSLMAEAFTARWLEKDGVLYFDRGPVQEKAERDAYEAAFESALPKALASSFLDVASEYDLSTASQLALQATSTSPDWFAINAKTPAGRLGKRLLRDIGAAELMRIPLGTSITYSTTPRTGERQIPAQLLRRFREESEVHAKALEQAGVTGHINGVQGFVQLQVPPHVEVVVRRSQIELSAVVSLGTTDRGVQTAFIDVPIGLDSPNLVVPEGTTFRMSAVGQAIVDNIVGRSTGNQRTPREPLAPEYSQLVRSIPDFEPLSEIATPAFGKLQSTMGKNVLALVPDDAFLRSQWRSLAGEHPLQLFIKSLESGGLRFIERDDVLIAAPELPSSVRDQRLSRTALAEFFRTYEREGRLTLDSIAILAESVDASTSVGQRGFWDLLLLTSIAIPDALDSVAFDLALPLRVYSALDQQTRQAAMQGWIEVPYDRLAPVVQERVKQMMLGGMARAWTTTDVHLQTDWSTSYSIARADEESTRSMAASRLPQGTYLRMRILDEHRLTPASNQENAIIGGLDSLDTIARMHVIGRQDTFDFSRFIVKPAQRFNLWIVLPDGRSAKFFAEVTSHRLGARPIAPDQFPEPLKSRFAAAVARAKGGK